eukprot:564290-Prorocentrum_minimum.AAC.1
MNAGDPFADDLLKHLTDDYHNRDGHQVALQWLYHLYVKVRALLQTEGLPAAIKPQNKRVQSVDNSIFIRRLTEEKTLSHFFRSCAGFFQQAASFAAAALLWLFAASWRGPASEECGLSAAIKPLLSPFGPN